MTSLARRTSPPIAMIRRILGVLTVVAALAGPLVASPPLAAADPVAGQRAKPSKPSRPVVRLAAPALTLTGHDVLTTTTVRPVKRGALVRIQARRSGSWVVVARGRQDSRGVVRASVAGPALGLLRLRALSAGVRPGVSPSILTRVVPPEEQLPDVANRAGSQEDLDVSADGRVVVYSVRVHAADGSVDTRAFAQDRLTGRTSQLPPAPGHPPTQTKPAVSPTGRYVVHRSTYARPQTSAAEEVRFTDLASGRTTTIPDVSGFRGADISADGRYVAVTADHTPAGCRHSSNPYVGREQDVVVLDRRHGSYWCATSGLQLGSTDFASPPTLSADGNTVSWLQRYYEQPNTSLKGNLVIARRSGERRVVDSAGRSISARGTDDVSAVLGYADRPGTDVTDIGRYDVATGGFLPLSLDLPRGGFDGALSSDGAFAFIFTNTGTGYGEEDPTGACVVRKRLVDGVTDDVTCDAYREDFAASGDATSFVYRTPGSGIGVRTLAR